MCCKCCGETQRKSWVFGIGSVFTLLGILLVVLWPNLADKLVENVSIFIKSVMGILSSLYCV